MKINISYSGFTIVELLIVIVVISILAVMVLVSFHGVQAQARNSQTASVVRKYKEALRLYAVDNRQYPINGFACLGTGYGDYNNDGSAGDCWHLDNPVKENTTLNTSLKPYLGGQLPVPSLQVLESSFKQVGAILIVDNGLTLNGSTHPWFLAYTIEGKQAKCPLKETLSFATGGWPNFSTNAPSSGYTESYGDVGVGCFIALQDPSK